MKRLLFIALLVVFSCEDKQDKDTTPTPVVLYDIEYQDTLMVFKWSICMDEDLFKYSLFSSDNESMGNKELLFESSNRIDTTFTQTITIPLFSYQIQVMNLDGKKSLSNIIVKQVLKLFSNIFGGSENDYASSVQQTTDGGYIITGFTDSFGDGNYDTWLIKADSLGNEDWSKTFGGSGEDRGYFVQQTMDGGYIITGLMDMHDAGELWLIKTDSQGNEEWNRTFSVGDENNWNIGYSVQQTVDGGFIITGLYSSNGTDIWLIKTDSQGNEEWNQTFNGGDLSTGDVGYSVQQTLDGGYIITGARGVHHKPSNVWLIKTDSYGDSLWTKTFDYISYYDEYGTSVQQTTDGGYIIAGAYCLIKTDSQGNEEWHKKEITGNSVQQTTDGGYIILGYRLIKTDSQGNIEWDKNPHGIEGKFVQQTTDGGYIIVGHTNFGSDDWNVYLIKTDSQGNKVPLSEWGDLSTGAYAVYLNYESYADTYGYLYNWYAVEDERGVCPEDWNVPTDDEYTTLTDSLGGESVAGGKLKECTEDSCPESEYWSIPNTGATNESGFTGLPGGKRDCWTGNDFRMGDNGYFWSSTELNGSIAWNRELDCNDSEFDRRSEEKEYGFSVRCVRD